MTKEAVGLIVGVICFVVIIVVFAANAILMIVSPHMWIRRVKYHVTVPIPVAKVRSRVEWPFRILKRVFGFTRVRYRGLRKNHEWLCAAFAAINIYQHRKRLAPMSFDKLVPQVA